MKHIVFKKLILSGNILEHYEYELPIIKGNDTKKSGRANAVNTSAEIKKINRKRTAQRAKTIVRRMANSNADILKKFLTLTFKDNVTDIDRANYEFKKFRQKVEYHYHIKFQHIVVVEFQERGAIHFHLLCNLPYIDVNKLSKLWGNGFIRLNKIDNIDNVGAYITKYMTKDSIDERLTSKKCYFCSRGLKKPEEITNPETIEEILDNLENVKRIHTSDYESEYNGIIHYTQIVLFHPVKNSWKMHLPFVRLPDDTPTPFDAKCPCFG